MVHIAHFFVIMEGVVIKDRFRLTQEIGHGAFGQIFRAVDLATVGGQVINGIPYS